MPTTIPRPEELLFSDLLTFKSDVRLLALHAASGYGKTTLLEKFKQACLEAKPTLPVSLVAFDQINTASPVLLLERLAHDLRTWHSFSNFERANNARLGKNFGQVSAMAGASNLKAKRADDDGAIPLKLVGRASVPKKTRFDIQDLVSKLTIRGLSGDEEALAVEVCISAFNDELDKALKRARTPIVILFDAYEHCPPALYNWLTETFFKQHVFSTSKHKRLLVVVAGQEIPEWPPEAKAAVQTLALSTWTQDDYRRCLQAYGVDETFVQAMHTANLRPLQTALFAQTAAKHPGAPLTDLLAAPTDEFSRRMWKTLVEAEGADNPDWGKVLSACVIPQRIDAQIIGAIRQTPDDPEGNTDLLNLLKTFSFVQARQAGGYVIHENLREPLLEQWRSQPDFADISQRIADVYMHQWAADITAKRYGEALVSIGYGAELRPDATIYASLHGLTYALMGVYETALGEYSRAVELDSDDASAFSNRALTYVQLDRHEEALTSFSRALELEPDAATYTNRGTCYAKLHRWDEALADFARAVELDPQLEEAYNSRGFVYYHLERWDEAAADYQRTIELKPDHAAAHNNLGLIAHALDDYDKAIEHYTRAIKLQPEYVNAYNNRGMAYHDSGRNREAITDFNRAIHLDSTRAGIYYNRALAYDAQERRKEAINDYSRAIELIPTYASAYFQRGHAYHGMQQWQQALADYNKAIELAPEYSGGWLARAGLYFAIERFQESIDDYNHALELDPNEPAFTISRGMCLQFMQRYEEALADFDRTIELEPDNKEVFIHRANTLVSLGRFDEATIDYGRALAAFPDEDQVHFQRGNMFSNMQRYDEAVADFDRAIKLNPKNTDALIGKGLVMTYTARFDEAAKVYKRVYDINPKDFTNLYNLAVVTVRAKGLENSRKELFNAHKALEKLLNGMYHGRGLYGLGGLAALEGDIDSAINYLKQSFTYERQAPLWATKDIAWLDLRDHPKFKAAIK